MNLTALKNAAEILRTSEYAAFAELFRSTFLKSDRINLTGTGDAGRLAIRLERAWLKTAQKLMEQYPQAVPALEARLNYFRHVDIGGEYSVIATPPYLPDSNIFGRGMMRATGVASANRDILICLDPTGSTPSTLGSAHYGLIHLAPTYILTCQEPQPEKNRHTKEVYTHPNCRYMVVSDLRVMEILCAVAIEAALCDVLESAGVPGNFPGYEWFAQQLEAMNLTALSGAETTLLADEYLLDALCFAAEHPNFQAKNPNRETSDAWEHCFLRMPRCLEWTADFYQSLGFSNHQIQTLPNITAKALLQVPVGKETLSGESGLNVDALLDGMELPETYFDIFQHLSIRLLLDSLTN